MTKVLLGLQFMSSSLIHLFCCGLPVLISIGGGLSVYIALQTFKPYIFCFQFIFFFFTLYQLYAPSKSLSKSIRKQRILFWIVSAMSFILFLYPPTHWFKSEETRLRQAQMERFFKHKNQ